MPGKELIRAPRPPLAADIGPGLVGDALRNLLAANLRRNSAYRPAALTTQYIEVGLRAICAGRRELGLQARSKYARRGPLPVTSPPAADTSTLWGRHLKCDVTSGSGIEIGF
jgi:hypothetical protein